MEYIDKAGKTELILFGGAALLVFVIAGGYLSYETITNFDEVKKDIHTGKTILESATGLPVIEHIIKPVVNDFEEPFEIVSDIHEGGLTYAKEKYIERETPLSSQWVEILGSDSYNDGFASLRYSVLRENAEALAIHLKKSPVTYFSELAPATISPFIWAHPYDNEVLHQISPFKIRQQLDRTPFAGYLHGLAGTNATTLMHFIWTEYDEIPDKLNNWNNLSQSEKNKVIKLIKEDRALSESMDEHNNYNAWIVKDRVLNINNLLNNYNITF